MINFFSGKRSVGIWSLQFVQALSESTQTAGDDQTGDDRFFPNNFDGEHSELIFTFDLAPPASLVVSTH